MAPEQKITTFEVDFGEEATAPVSAGGKQPPTSLYRVKTGECFVKIKEGKQPQTEVPWTVIADPLKAGGLGKGMTDWQTIPNAKQDPKNKATTSKFFKKLLVATGQKPESAIAIKGKKKLDLGKMLSNKEAWLYYIAFEGDGSEDGAGDKDSETHWLDAEEAAKVQAGTLKIVRKAPKRGKGPGFEGAVDDLGAATAAPNLDDDLGGGSNGTAAGSATAAPAGEATEGTFDDLV